MSKEVSEQYIENISKNADNSVNINVILEHSKYIVASMNNINLYFEVYKPHQLVALIKEYTTYMEMSYDDEINYDAYLYGIIDGNGKVIRNLNVCDSLGNHVFIANYGVICDVEFIDLKVDLFKTYGPGEMINVNGA